jgi:hypothetical protein
VHIDDDGMGPYIVDIFSLTLSMLLNIVNGTCVNKCPIATFLLVHMVGANNPLVPIFSERLRWRPKVFPHLFGSEGEIFLVKLKVHWPIFVFGILHLWQVIWKHLKYPWAMMLNCVIEIFCHFNIPLQCTIIPVPFAQPKMCQNAC